MEQFIDKIFPSSSRADKRHILQTLNKLGVDSPSDLRLVEQSDLNGLLKVIYVRKLMEAVEKEQIEDECGEANDDVPTSSSTSSTDQTTKNLAVATGVLGAVGAVAVPLAVFAALFPPITLPIAVAIGISTGVVATAAAGTGIATAVRVNMKKNEEEMEGEENEDTTVEEYDKVNEKLMKLL